MASRGKHARDNANVSNVQPTAQMPQSVRDANEQWANAEKGSEFDMNRGKKSGCRRAATVLGTILLVAVVGVAIGAFLYLNHINELIGLGSDKDKIELVLSDQVVSEPYYMLLIGSDSREGVEGSDADWAHKEQDGSDGQADVMILARVDEVNKQITLLSIPRDTPWQLENGNWTKLNNVYTYGGASDTISAVSEVAGVPISHFAEIHMSEFMQLVDVVGGIDVDVPKRIDYHEALTNQNVVIEQGHQHLDGVEAEVYVRERTSYGTEQDMKRQAKVRTVVFAILDKIKQKPVWELPGIISECAACVTTDLSASDLLRMANVMGEDVTMYSGTGPYSGDEDPYAGGLWLCYQNPDGWARVMSIVESGGDPSTVTYKDDIVTIAGDLS